MALDPSSALALSNLGYAVLLQNRNAEAEEFSRQAMRYDPANCKTRYILAMALARQKKAREEAISLLRSTTNEMPEGRVPLAQLLAESGKRADASNELRAYLATGRQPQRAVAQAFLDRLTAQR